MAFLSKFRPMLAATGKLKFQDLRFPLIASVKIDGFRAFSQQDNLWSRSRKDFPNLSLYAWFQEIVKENYLDGELHIPGETFHRTQAVINRMLEPAHEVEWWIFDCFRNPLQPYAQRLEEANRIVQRLRKVTPRIRIAPYKWIVSIPDLKSYLEESLSEGWEGLILRDPAAPYKFGRSTLREGGMLRIKPTVDAEARIIRVLPRRKNLNPSEPDAYGRLKKRKTEGNYRTLPEAGKLVCQHLDPERTIMFEIGSGWDRETARRWWKERQSLIGKVVKFKYQQYGTLDRPRQPVFVCFRDEYDRSV